MSFKAFKQSLKHCSNVQIPPPSSSIQSQSSISDLNLNPSQPRWISPKISISQQVLRLQIPFSPPLKLRSNLPLHEKQHDEAINNEVEKQSLEEDKQISEDDEEEEEKIKQLGFAKPKLDVFNFGDTGPFEPLILSSDEFPVIQVPASINCRLLEHQREGVKFLYQLYKNNHGGILGDDMGLGKTIQTIAFLTAVFGKDGESRNPPAADKKQKGPVLIIGPASVLQNWESEFANWANFHVAICHGSNRDLIVDKAEAQELEIMITSFDTFRIYGDTISEVLWDIVIVDEAHRLKNEKSKLYNACLRIKTMRRYGLTGTVMQNKIMELFNLFDWVAPGSLGSREHFREFYDEPLKLGQRSGAHKKLVRIADERRQHLVALLDSYLLRRTKEETIGNLMLGKEDNIVFCEMSDLQKRAYKRMLQQPEIRCLMNKDNPCSCGSPLTQGECHNRIVSDGIIWKYLHKDSPDGCNWCPVCLILPCILKLQQISNHVELIKPNPKDDPDKQKKDADLAKEVFGHDIDLVGGNAQNESFMGLSDAKDCGKMKTLERLLASWLSHGDKVLLFSHSVRMLDILEKFLIRKGYCFLRLDGSTPTGLRQSLVNDFNSSPSKQVFLVSTRAGGLGLNLVSANRVVIFDPNWNPSHDLQAQDRSFRLGQTRHVVVFRLIAACSLEELMYTRQVYKQQLSNIAVSGKMEKRYFEGVQDHKQFQGELFGIGNLFRDLSNRLFTSEIIEHEMQGHEGHQHTGKENMSNLGLHFDLPMETSESSVSESRVKSQGTLESIATKNPLLEELATERAIVDWFLLILGLNLVANWSNFEMGCCRRDESIMGFIWRKKLGFFSKVILGLLVGFVLFEPATSLRPLRERARSWGDEWLFVKKEDSNMASFSSWNISGTYRGTWNFLDSTNISSRFPDFQRSDGNSVIELMSTPTKITGVHYIQGVIIFHDAFDDDHEGGGAQIRVEGVYIWPFRQLRMVANSGKDSEFNPEEDYLLSNPYHLLGVFSSQVFQDSPRDNIWKRKKLQVHDIEKHCNIEIAAQVTRVASLQNDGDHDQYHLEGLMESPSADEDGDCFSPLLLNATSVNIEVYYNKAVNYTLMVTFVSFLQVLLLIRQMEHSNTQSGAAKVSILMIGQQAIMDAYLCLLHLTAGILVESLFNAFATAAFFKFVVFSIFEMRYLLAIWKASRPANSGEGWEAMRRELSLLYSRFYGLLLGGILIMYEFHNFLRPILLLMYSFWIPQIITNIVRDSRKPLHPHYILGMTFTRLAIPLYVFGCPNNFMRIGPDKNWCICLCTFLGLQSLVLLLQHYLGSRCFIPRQILPEKYSYYRRFNQDGNRTTDCVICMTSIDLSERSSDCMVTPCDHFFHSGCLQRWMDIKMECPTCRRSLPPA